MQEPRELVIKINQEEKELNEKLTRLEYFMMTEDYQRISDRQKLLLKQQHEAMTAYKRILIARAIQINFEEKDKEEPEYPLCPRETDTSCCFKKAGKCTAPATHCYKSMVKIPKAAAEIKETAEAPKPNFPCCPYTPNPDCSALKEGKCTVVNSVCYKAGVELKEEENGTQSNQ